MPDKLGEKDKSYERLTERFDLALWATKSAIWDWDIEENLSGARPAISFCSAVVTMKLRKILISRITTIRGCRACIPMIVNALCAVCTIIGKMIRPMKVEYCYRLPDGEYTWIRSLGQVVRAPDGRPLRMVGMNVDISGPKWAEAKREIEARLSAVLENAPVAIIWKDANGKYEYANSVWLKRTGLTSEQMRGKAAHDLFPHAVPLIETQDRKVVETGAAVQFEFEEEIDSHARWFIVTKFPVIDANGRVTSIVSMETDITDKKRAEQALESELS